MKFTVGADPKRADKRRPANHFALRGAGGRLLLFVVMLLLVLWAMYQAAKPESWYWLVGPEKTEAIDARETPPGHRLEEVLDSDSPSALKPRSFNSAKPDSQPPQLDELVAQLASTQGQTADSIAQNMRVDFWRETIALLSISEQLELLKLVNHGAAQKPLATGESAALNSLLNRISKRRQAFHVTLLEKLARPTQPQAEGQAGRRLDERSSDALMKIQVVWDAEIYPALRAVVDEQVDASLITESVAQFPALVQTAATQLVRDHSQVSRNAETYAWFSAWNEVFDAPLVSNVDNPVSINRLLGQPKVYRGQTITLNGTALRIDQVRAGRNDLGIDQYFVVWIKPDHASSYPFCLYTLHLPDELSFEPGQPTSKNVESPIRANARFFKVRLYDAGQPAQAPLLMSASLLVVPEAAVARTTRRRPLGPGTTILFGVVIFAFGASIVWRIHRASTHARGKTESSPNQLEKNLDVLKDDTRIETVAEKLERLATRSRQESESEPRRPDE